MEEDLGQTESVLLQHSRAYKQPSHICPYSHPHTTTMSDLDSPYDLRAKYSRFRILVIGRANAGKTTLLQRVCNTTEDPCIYDKNDKNLVSAHRADDQLSF
jgi:predicted GTPase